MLRRAFFSGGPSRVLRFIALGIMGPAVYGGGGCSEPRELPPCVESPPPNGPRVDTGGDPVIVGAGDIAIADNLAGAAATSALLDHIDGQVITLGDNAYERGTIDEFLDIYAPTWGRHRWRTRPAVGNHEYGTPHAAPYFAYFCDAAGEPFKGFYSYNLGAWHIVVLNSNCVESTVDAPPCSLGSEQERWLRADLAAHPVACTLAYWHHARFSSGSHGGSPAMQDVWQTLYEANADVVLSGHDHIYERFAPQTPTGEADGVRGIREFVVGTGAARPTRLGPPQVNSEVQREGIAGVLKVTLHAKSYEWQFIAVGGRVEDSGEGSCH